MMDVSAPPVHLTPPAIIRPIEARLLAPGFLPASRDERRSALAELVASGRLSRVDATNALVMKLPPAAAMLLVTQLIGFGAGPADAVPPASSASATFTANVSSATTSLAYSFTSQNFGTASADRHILVGTAAQAGTPTAVSSMTIGGISASQVFARSGTNSTVAFWIAPVPTGTSGTVFITWAAQRARCAAVIWALTGLLSTTAVDSGSAISSGSSPLSDTVDVAAGGVCFAMAYDTGTGNRSWTWTGLTEMVDQTFASGRSYTGASAEFATAQSGLTVQAAPSGNTTANVLSIVSMR
jgi:hypothetical protein